MITCISQDRVLLTPELAREFATMAPMPGERQFKQTRMNALRKLFEAGKFKTMLWAKGTERGQSVEWRINGQHTSKMFAAMAQEDPEAFPKDLYVTIWVFTWDLPEERADVFAMFDSKLSERDNVDHMGIFRAQHADLNIAGMTDALLVKLTNGLNSYYSTGDRARKLTTMDRGIYLHDKTHREFFRWALEFDDAVASWLLGKSGIVAQMYDDFVNRDRPAIAKFWNYVFNQNHPLPDHETHEMVEMFESWREGRRHKQFEWRKKAAAASRRFNREFAQSGDPGTADVDDDEDAADSRSAVRQRQHLTEDDLTT